MKIWNNIHYFNFPWETVVEAAYHKYPTRHNPNVLSLDVLERRTRPSMANGSRHVLYSHRIFCTLWSVPSIVINILGINDVMYIREESECDINRKRLKLVGVNLSLRNMFKMTEILEYTPDPNDASKTVLKQSASMDVYGVPLLGNLLESIFISSYESTVSKGRNAIIEKSELLLNQK
jgi:hypothetical protein